MKDLYDVLILGCGAAGLACADRLWELGVGDICVLADDDRGGASRNAGSDKQTYYKPDFCAGNGDGVPAMARDLFAGGSVSGEKALVMAAESARCFMRLVEAGVPFPADKYGRFIGYRTDHDDTCRATSAGPYTSRYMTEALEKKVRGHNVPIIGGMTVIRFIVKDGVFTGVVCVKDGGLVTVRAKAAVIACGAPADIYAGSVYPKSQHGVTGAAAAAGVSLCNFQEWQYGVASVKVRWNLSGSYQQVIPGYFSVGADGERRYFLTEALGPDEAYSMTFLKGYQWPFDFAKLNGSSRVDALVTGELRAGRRVFIDFTKEPEGLEPDRLCKEARDFWQKTGLEPSSPYERLMKLNPKAAEVYSSRGVDLAAEPLEISVCAQHNNGGIKTGINGETDIGGLFAIGEAAGNFGVYRPGGSALNDTQVGAFRTAGHLAKIIDSLPAPAETDCPETLPRISDEPTLGGLRSYFASRMSLYCGAVRDLSEIKRLERELGTLLEDFSARVTVGKDDDPAGFFRFRSAARASLDLCRTVLFSAENAGSRGGCVCVKDGETLPEKTEFRKYLTVTAPDKVYAAPADPIPEETPVFEELLKTVREPESLMRNS